MTLPDGWTAEAFVRAVLATMSARLWLPAETVALDPPEQVRALFPETPPADAPDLTPSLMASISELRGLLNMSRQHNAKRWSELCAARADRDDAITRMTLTERENARLRAEVARLTEARANLVAKLRAFTEMRTDTKTFVRDYTMACLAASIAISYSEGAS